MYVNFDFGQFFRVPKEPSALKRFFLFSKDFSAIKNEENLRRIKEEKIERDATASERKKWEKELKRQLEQLRNEISQRLLKV